MAPLSTLVLTSEPSICANRSFKQVKLWPTHHVSMSSKKASETPLTRHNSSFVITSHMTHVPLASSRRGRGGWDIPSFWAKCRMCLLLLQHVAADINSQHVIGDHLHTIIPRTFVFHDSRYASQQAHLIKLVVVWFYIFLSVTPSMRQSSYNPATAPHTANAVSANTHNVEQRIIFWSFNSDKNIKCHNTYLSVTILECIFLWN